MLRLALLLCLLPVLLLAQPDTLWTRTFDGPGYAWHSVCLTADGRYIAVGEGGSANTFGYDLRVARLDSAGAVLWDRVADMGQHEYGRAVLPMPDGGYIAAGCAHAYIDEWPYELFLARMNAPGDTQWCHIYGGVDMYETYVMGMDTVPGGGYVMVSTTDVDSSLSPVLIRVSENGDSLWSRVYRRALWDNGVDVVSLSDGYAILGTCAGSWSGSAAYHLIRTNAAGDTLWTRIYLHLPGGVEQDPVCIARTLDGGFIIGGNVWQQNNSMIWLVCTNNLGDTLWTREISGPGNWVIGDVQLTHDGGFAVAGLDSTSWLLAKLDHQGNVVWTRTADMGDAYGTLLESVRETPDNGFVAVGSNFARPFALKTTPDIPMAAGPPAPQAMPQTFSLHPCSPNPFNSATRISFDLPRAGDISLNLFDITGRSVATVAQGKYSAGSHSILFDASGLASGMYFYQLRAGSFVATRKMILLR